jgi:hypothetical protein
LFALLTDAHTIARLFGVAIKLMEDPKGLRLDGLMQSVRLILEHLSRASPAFARNAMTILRGIAEQKY